MGLIRQTPRRFIKLTTIWDCKGIYWIEYLEIKIYHLLIGWLGPAISCRREKKIDGIYSYKLFPLSAIRLLEAVKEKKSAPDVSIAISMLFRIACASFFLSKGILKTFERKQTKFPPFSFSKSRKHVKKLLNVI